MDRVFDAGPTAIELGVLRIISATSLKDVIWFLAGLLLLTGLTFIILWWNRRARPDPFL